MLLQFSLNELKNVPFMSLDNFIVSDINLHIFSLCFSAGYFVSNLAVMQLMLFLAVMTPT